MYISSVKIKNFRGVGEDGVCIHFNSKVNVLVGENDSGKSTVMDAIRFTLGTTDMHWNNILPTDFYGQDTSRTIHVTCHLTNLTDEEKAATVEYLTLGEDGNFSLYVSWDCSYSMRYTPPRIISNWHSGKDGDGPSFIQEVQELFRVTYLKALRDAYMDMQPGRNSRLSQVLKNISEINEGTDKWESGVDPEALSLVGITNLVNELLQRYVPLQKSARDMSNILQQDMLLSNDNIWTKFSISESARTNEQKIALLLEKIGLTIDTEHSNSNGLPGLGTSNIMSMACELLLRMTGHEQSKFLLIEEPEAHIHPQRQMKLMKSFEKDASAGNRQIILTTHSPLLASAAKLDDIIVMKDDHPYPLNHQCTKLGNDDYQYLERFLDATKANLFFARGVLIVEGAGEELLLPTISRLLNRDFSDYGVSIVNVGGKGFSRYARIFLRQDNKPMGVPIACIADRDIRPDQYASFVEKNGGTVPAQNRRNWKLESEVSSKPGLETKDQDVKTFLSNRWTLEYDLAFYGLADPSMAQCLFRAMSRTTTSKFLVDKAGSIEETIKKFDDITLQAIRLHQYFGSYSKAIFAQALAGELATKFSNKPDQLRKCLPPYLVAAIEYVTGVN